MHPARTPRGGVECGLKDRAEDGRADRAPVEARACIIEQDIDDLLCELRDLDVLLCEESPVDVGECGEGIREVRVAALDRCVEHAKELDEGLAEERERHVTQVVMEHGVLAEEPCVLGVEGKDETDTEDVETLLAVWVAHVAVLFGEGVVESADELARLDGDLHFLLDVRITRINEEVQAICLALEVGEENFLRLGIRRLHVVDEELCEVAADDPARARGVRQCRRITARLFDGFEEGAVALADRVGQFLSEAFLLDHDVCRRDHHVDKARVVELYLLLKDEQVGRIFHAVDAVEELHPEFLALALLVAPPLPLRSKFPRRLCLCCRIHRAASSL